MVVEVKPSLLVSLKLMILIKKIIFLSEHQQPQIGETSSDSQSTVIVRNQDDAIARLDSAAGKFFFFFFFRPLFLSVVLSLVPLTPYPQANSFCNEHIKA